jgi:allantoicase
VAAPDASVEELNSDRTSWMAILPKSELKGDSQNPFAIESPYRFTHLRFNIFPDGGVARLRVHGEVLPDWRASLAVQEEMDLLAIEHGGRVLGASDLFFSHPQNLMMPGRGARMDDGWETKRRRGPGHDWCMLQLGIAGVVRRVVVDTAHFKGNYPESCSLEVCRTPASYHIDPASLHWTELLPRAALQADHVHVFEEELAEAGEATHVRFNIYPDGGVSRLRLFGVPSREGRMAEGLRWLNALLPEAAAAALQSCCGSARWAQHMAQARPFRDAQHVCETSDRIWAALGKDDWLEAFRAHPRIGERKAEAQQSAEAQRWSAQEQSAVSASSADTRAALAEANRAYQARFGHIFLICATGKSSEEILASLRERMKNDPQTEIRVAAEEQRRIARLRLEKWMAL